MAETVSTGGIRQFQYPKGYRPKVSKEFKIEIENAYSQARERKKKERNRKIWIWVIITILILTAIGVWWFSRS